MNRIESVFADKKAFIAFLTGGDPDIETTEKLIPAMAEAGTDIIEIGIPFSDPVAEGIVIQEASQRALKAGCTTDKLFEMVSRIRYKTNIPILFMTYLNPINTYGKEKFLSMCAKCGIDGIIVPDLPFDEKDELEEVCVMNRITLISMIALTSGEDRIRMISQEARGFIYCVSSLGVTGIRSTISQEIKDIVKKVLEHTNVPCAIGFGISTPEQAIAMAGISDGVIVGSAIVKLIAEYGRDSIEPVKQFISLMRENLAKGSDPSAKIVKGSDPTPKLEEANMYKNILSKATTNQELSEQDIFELISAIKNDQVSDVQIAGFQVALLMKGASLKEMSHIAKAMRDNCVPLRPRVSSDLMDTCGTGGGLSTFNISTATAIVAAAAGIPVAKHGSRSISSLSGSADVLEALGVNINLTPRQAEKLIEDIGIAFIYAPLFHPVMCKVLPAETDLGIKTIFYTIIGPLINPAFAPRHILGVYKPELLDTVSYVARDLGYTNAMFVYGLDGLDEISLLGKTRINELINGEIKTYEIQPEDFGIERCTLDEIKTGTPEENARTILGVFDRSIKGPRRNAILLNAAGALKVGSKADSFEKGIALAAELIDSGAAEEKLQQLCKASNSFREN